MTLKVKYDPRVGMFRDRKTGQFLAFGERIYRVKLEDGWAFRIDEPEPDPFPEPTEEAKRLWGEFA